jgi:hypothetical protein
VEDFCVVLDTSVWRSEFLLNTPKGAAFLFIVKRSNAKIGLPEIVEKEISKVIVKACRDAAKQARKHLQKLEPITGYKLGIEDSEDTFAACVRKRLSQLEIFLKRLPFTHEHAVRALDRVIQELPPNGPDDEQFRDSAIWEVVMGLARTEAVHFITGDTGFFKSRKPELGPAENIQADIQRQEHRIEIHFGLNSCLSALRGAGPMVEKEPLARSIESALRPDLSQLAANRRFALGNMVHFSVEPFLTEQTGVLAIEFELTFEVDNLSEETREEARMVSSGSCLFNVSDNSISDIRKRLEEFSWRDEQGLPQKSRNYYMLVEEGSLVVSGQRTPPPYSFRAPVEKSDAP